MAKYFISPDRIGGKLEEHVAALNKNWASQIQAGTYATQIERVIFDGIRAGKITIRRGPSFAPVLPIGQLPVRYEFRAEDVIDWDEARPWLEAHIPTKWQPVPPWAPKETREHRVNRLRARKDDLIRGGETAWQKKLAGEEGVSVARIKQLLKPADLLETTSESLARRRARRPKS